MTDHNFLNLVINPPDPHRENIISFKPVKTFIYTGYFHFSGRSNYVV